LHSTGDDLKVEANNAIRAINLDTNDVTMLAGHGDQEECNFKDEVGEEAR